MEPASETLMERMLFQLRTRGRVIFELPCFLGVAEGLQLIYSVVREANDIPR